MHRGDALVGLKRVGNPCSPIYIYDVLYSDGAFNAFVGALPLQIEVGVSKFFFTPTILSFLCLCKLSFQMSHRRLLTLRRLSILW